MNVELYAKKGQVAKQVGGKGELCPSQFKGGHQPSQDEAQLYREKEERLRERPPPVTQAEEGQVRAWRRARAEQSRSVCLGGQRHSLDWPAHPARHVSRTSGG